MSEQIIGYAQEFKPTIWHRLGFGHAGIAPWNDDDDAHYIVNDTVVVFDWRDRLRILVTGRIHVTARTRTETEVKHVETRAACKVMGWGWER